MLPDPRMQRGGPGVVLGAEIKQKKEVGQGMG